MSENPFNDQSEGRYLNNLLDIGPDKPLGYLPLFTLRDLCMVDPIEVAEYLRQRGLETREWDQSFCHVGSGALYAYDRRSLQILLDRNLKVLNEAGWPNQADDFVVQVATTCVEQPHLFDLVADAFADYQNPGRTNTSK